MAIAFVNRTAFAGSSTADARPTSDAPAANHTAGNLLVALMNNQSDDFAPALSDTAGNTWHPAVAPYNDASGPASNWLSMQYAWNCLGNPSNIVRSTWANGTPGSTQGFGELVVLQFSGVLATGDPLRDASTGKNSSGGVSAFTDAFIGASGDVICEFVEAFPVGISSSTYTLTVVDTYFADGYAIATGPQLGVATVTSGAGWVIEAAAFKPAPDVAPSAAPLITTISNQQAIALPPGLGRR